ncbi:MAG: hypothetical protein R2822_15105 [Spirosomataceae bacterium]
MPLSLTVDLSLLRLPHQRLRLQHKAQLHDPHKYYCHHCPYWTNYPIQCRRSLQSSTSFTGLMPNNCKSLPKKYRNRLYLYALSLTVDPVPAPPVISEVINELCTGSNPDALTQHRWNLAEQ